MLQRSDHGSGFCDDGASQQRIESGDQRQGYGTSRRAGGGVGESDSQQPAALGLGRLCWLRGIEMELVFQSDDASRRN